MNSDSERMREHPEIRFSATQHHHDLDEATRSLLAEPLAASRNHRQKTLYKGSDAAIGPVTLALFVFNKGASMPRHTAQGVAIIQVLEGEISLLADDNEHHLCAHQILVLSPGVPHDVRAVTDARMLLTVCLGS